MTSNTFIRNPYNYDADLVSYETGLCCTDPTRTQQQFKDDADINNIMREFGVTGQLPANVRQPQYADFSEAINDYQSALNVVRAAQEDFMQLPSNIRARFQNDPQQLLEFCEDPRNLEEAQKLGLTKKPLDLGPKTADNNNAATSSATKETQ